ncbi:ankyrin repeat domain-containing protein [Pantoea sp. S61]|uniref:ankyrin repeat domain-containing protein n=1 Tax=Pantoea sp. S61 TaxID=2767442 RepID=UPI0019091A07|nr:ankyrin repeat domain-containing protein [Pantoea sp. S61]MBK0127073.1 ankyrin repeat domain-containing protein [Pantoea sp. S61]
MEKSIFNIRTEDEYLFYKNEIDINELDDTGSNALFYSDYGKDYGKTEWLLKNGINFNVVNKAKQNALFFCNYEKAKLLIEHGIEVNQVDVNGESPLFRAVASSNTDTCQLLIDSKADIHKINNQGENVVFYASLKALRLLLNLGININQIDQNGNNALISLDTGMYDCLKIAKCLVGAGINFEIFERDPSKLDWIDSCSVREHVVQCISKKENKHINKIIKKKKFSCEDVEKRKRL